MTAQQLKNSILQMAVQGKLVPQDPNDEPASVLLERIRKEKEQLIKEGKIKREKNPSVIFRGADNTPYEKTGHTEPVSIADEVPFDIPDSWAWLHHNSFFEVSGGSQPPKDKFIFSPKDGYVRLYQIRDYGKSPVPVYIPVGDATKTTKKGDILLARYGASLGKVFFAEDGAYNVAMAKVIPLFSGKWVLKEYLYVVYQSKLYQDVIFCNSRSAQAGFNKEDLETLWIPVPPINEQKRIVEKYKEILLILEKYDQAEAALATLNSSFPLDLKKSILQMAVQGKLVPQDSTDEQASILLERIRAEKEKLISEGKIKRDKSESVIFRRDNSHYEKLGDVECCIDEEIPFEIPDSWELVRLGEIVSKEIKRGKSPKYAVNGKTLVFAQKCNVKAGRIDLTLAKYLDDSAFNSYPVGEYMISDDIVVNSTGNGTLGRVGYFQETDRIGNGEVVPDSHVTIVRVLSSIEPRYIYNVLKYYQPILEKQGEGSTNQTELKPAAISSLIVPIPPRTEQQRIVNALDNALEMIKQL